METSPPKTVAAAMKIADVIFTPTIYSMTHTDTIVDATGAGTRALILRGIIEEMIIKGAMTADYRELRRIFRARKRWHEKDFFITCTALFSVDFNV